MIHAYDSLYLEKAQVALGSMMDYAVTDLKYDADVFFHLFIASGYAYRFGIGDCSLTVGRSGVELAWMILEKTVGDNAFTPPSESMNRSPEYWAGWALAYYQWSLSLSFQEIVAFIPFSEMIALYSPYHEMDIQQFCDKVTDLYKRRNPETNLKRLRKMANMTQNKLASQSGIPLRTIQQYEQRQKDINKAQAQYLIALTRVLHCGVEDLIEKV